mgnify:CR=1 FL=1
MRIIAGKWKGHALQTPKNNLTRPTSDRIREALFSALESRIELNESHVLDLFAGTGALGLEALSRGAGTCYFVEKMLLGWNVTMLRTRDHVQFYVTKFDFGDINCSFYR